MYIYVTYIYIYIYISSKIFRVYQTSRLPQQPTRTEEVPGPWALVRHGGEPGGAGDQRGDAGAGAGCVARWFGLSLHR